MGTTRKKRAQPSSDRQTWDIIFNALKQMLRKQAAQIDFLLEQRKLLQERIQIQYERWNSDVCVLEDQISQMQRQLSLSELGNLVEIAKADLLVGLKQRDALIHKLKLEHARSELDDFKAWFDILSHRCPDKEDIPPDRLYESLAKGDIASSSKDASKNHSKLEKEVAMLKREYEKLSVKLNSDISALEAEKIFVWNQYKEMEANYTDRLQTRNDEINQANEKIMKLLASMEQLQSWNTEKDETVGTLRANITKLEAEVNQKDADISRISKELELLRSENCELSSSSLKRRKSNRNRKPAALEEEASPENLEGIIATLSTKLSKLEAEANQKNGEISAISRELKLLQSKSAEGMPGLKRCTNEPYSSKLRGKGNGKDSKRSALETEAFSAQLEATIAALRAKFSKLEAEANRENGEISTLSKELKLLRSGNAADTPPPTGELSSSMSRSRGRDRSRGSTILEKKSSSVQPASDQGGRRSKRKQHEVVNIEDTPKLFTSQFKVPRLRSQSPLGR